MKEKIEVVKELISLAEENQLTELSVAFKGFKIEIKKSDGQPTVVHGPSMFTGQAAQVSQPAAPPAEPAKAARKHNGVPIKSPLAGVFYEAPKPGAPPFVKVGDMVEADTVLCIVEAMKLMNEIVAERKGKIVEVCKKNGEVAEDGDVLFYLEPGE